MAKQKYYAYFFDEKNNGIVDTWSECEKIVHGTKARYKSFIDKSVAQDWLDSGANYEKKISLKTPVNTTLEKGIYFDSGTGRGIGVEVRVTDENKENILDKISPSALKELLKDTTWIKNEFGNIQFETKKTNNFGELIGFYFALNCAKLLKYNLILGDSRLVIDYWSLGRFYENNLELETINYINKVIQLRKEFEKNKGIVRHISGDVNPADLGFHK
ncbi:ribonuclease H family protein [Fusobacterium polymorphum]|jgi:caulimovirus viroplasmin|uniref:Ribonuclease HI n=1 Tax=Fusobacterium nucleatum subsp. polymorphum TaxID=76857 RepID=A0A2C6CCN8_FUSNP|nr:viroplasmin family protein [Fusobacterium polymorphum]PHI13822.1 ribonuclease HI [Fusobacterium polymorphum]